MDKPIIAMPSCLVQCRVVQLWNRKDGDCGAENTNPKPEHCLFDSLHASFDWTGAKSKKKPRLANEKNIAHAAHGASHNTVSAVCDDRNLRIAVCLKCPK